RVIGDNDFELKFAVFLQNCDEVLAFAKNYLAVQFKLDYVTNEGGIGNYYPDFLVKLKKNRIVIAETKGREDLDVPHKRQRLRQWCEDLNRVQKAVQYDFVYVDQDSYEKFQPKTMQQLLDGFREFKG
ncbi:MAG: type III restriction endonuclease subunit R, partial [Planctomycetota bacterium]